MDITNKTRASVPDVPFTHIKNEILGAHYALSLVCIGERRARTLTTTYKHRAYNANVLSFPLTNASGEIFINLRKARKEARRFAHTETQHVAFLFIHACLHLAGYEHGEKMEKREDTYMLQFVT